MEINRSVLTEENHIASFPCKVICMRTKSSWLLRVHSSKWQAYILQIKFKKKTIITL